MNAVKKKICFITTIGGTLRVFVLKLAEYLHNTGEFDISFLCTPEEQLSKMLPDYIHLIPVPMERGISISGFKAMWQMKRIFDKEKFDIVQYSTPNAACYASIAAWLSRVPVRLYCQWGIAYVGFSGLKRKIFKLEEKMVCTLSTWVEPDSRSNLEFSHKEGLYPEKKGSVVWNGSASGVDLTKFDIEKKTEYNRSIRKQYGIPDDAFVYGFVGRITGDKGINELFTATKKVMEQHPNAWLLLVGHSEKAESVDDELYKWAESCDRVVFSGYTLVAEQFIATMDCFVLPSYREGFGMSVVEAEAMGVPVIITNIPGPIDGMLKNKTGLIVPKKDAVALQEAMVKLITSPELCRKFGENGAAYASENFEQKEIFRRIYEDRKELMLNGGRKKS